MMNSIQQFKQAMAHRLGKDTPPVIHGDGQVHTFMVKGKEWFYLLAVSKPKPKRHGWGEVDETAEVKEEAAGYFGTFAGAGEEYEFRTEGAYNAIGRAFNPDEGKAYTASVVDISYDVRDRFTNKRREELNKRFCSAWEKMEKHPDGQHRKQGEALYLPMRDWEGDIAGMVRTFPDFRVIDGSDGSGYWFVLLGELPNKPDRVVIAHEWSDAEEIRKATGLSVLFVPTFQAACYLADALRMFKYLPEETKIIGVDDTTRQSAYEWKASPDGLEPLNPYDSLARDMDDIRTLKQILNNQFEEEDTIFDVLDEPDLGYVLETGADIVALAEDISFLVPDFIPGQTLIEMHAPLGDGNSTLALQALGAVASGGLFLGAKAEKRPVVVCNYENSEAASKALIKRIDGAAQTQYLKDPPQIDQAEWVKLKIMTANLGNPVLLIDSLASACTSSDIGSNADLALVMRRLLELRNMGATILLLNHTLERDASNFIGAQVIISQSDHVVSLTPNANGSYRFGTSGKTRYGHFEKTLKFDLDRKLFILADNPDQEAIDSVLFALDLQSPSSVQQISTVTHLPAKKLRALLDRYENHHWKSERGSRNSKTYLPI